MWHFTKLDMKLENKDGRLVVPGQTLTVPQISMCNYGLHASPRLIDALKYASGPYVWEVALSGDIENESDKSVATERTALWGYDATIVLNSFARRVGLDAVKKYWKSEFGEFPEIVIEWLETGKEELRSAARSAAWSAAWSAAAAESAAWSAAWSAAAESAAWSEQNEWLTEMILAGKPKEN